MTHRASSRHRLVRRLGFAAMVVVTSWSLWAWAGDKPATHKVEPRPPAAVGGEDVRAAQNDSESEKPAPFNFRAFGGETPPYVAMLVNFGILAAGYYLLGKKPIAAGLKARRDTISKDIEEAQRMKREAEERLKIYKVKLEKLEGELHAAREALVRAGEAESERIVRDAEAKAERMRKDAEFLVQQEIKQIRDHLLRETVDAAMLAAEELLRSRVTQADQERLADEYLADLGGKARTPQMAPPRVIPSSSGPGQPS